MTGKHKLKKTERDQYDVIIIGAGIGGLVCGCYLSREGLKVLIVEKNSKAGGYCTSFRRNKFVFDSCVHSFGSCSPHEPLGEIINELGLNVQMLRFDPSDIIITPDHNIPIKNNMEETFSNIACLFPKERQIKKFFSFFEMKSGISLYQSLKNKTFKDLLDEYFNDHRIKAVFSILLANCGISPSVASAFTTILFLKSFVFNGGYYPAGGMQKFANSLVKVFESYGGAIVHGVSVRKMSIFENIIQKLILSNGEILVSKLIVSNADLRHTILELIGREHIRPQLLSQLSQLRSSSSAFIVYLGLSSLKEKEFGKTIGIWKMPDDYNIEKTFSLPLRGKMSKDNFVFCSITPNVNVSNEEKKNQSLRLIVNAPFKNEEFWKRNKDSYSEELIDRASSVIKGLKSNIVLKECATPQTLYRYTNNYKGSMCGWLNTKRQNESDLLENIGINNLYFVGHWVPARYGQGGVAMVAYSGKRIAGKILFNLGKEE